MTIKTLTITMTYPEALKLGFQLTLMAMGAGVYVGLFLGCTVATYRRIVGRNKQ